VYSLHRHIFNISIYPGDVKTRYFFSKMASTGSSSGRNSKYGTRISGTVVDAVILPRHDWKRIKRDSVHYTPAQQVARVQEEDARKKQTMRSMKDARSGLLEAESRTRQARKVQATEREMRERELALEVAEAKANEGLDEVKAMNTEVIGARVRTLP
jgi:hypothetical protein